MAATVLFLAGAAPLARAADPSPPPTPIQLWGDKAWHPYCLGRGWPEKHLAGGRSGVGTDVYTVNRSNQLHQYAINVTASTNGAFSPTVVHLGQRGQNWAGISQIMRLDWDGDGNWDLLATTKAGELRLYKVATNGAVTFSGTVGHGWGTGDTQITIRNAGDLSGDGRDDILAQKSDGTVLVYPVNRRVGAPRQIGRGFSQGWLI